MGKIDKWQQARMDGLARGLEIAKAGGIEALEQEVKFRGATKVPMNVDRETADAIFMNAMGKVYASYMTICYWTLNNLWHHGKKGLKAFKEAFDSHVMTLTMVDCYGGRYVRFREMAKELNDKYDLGIDMDGVMKVDFINDRGTDMRASIPAIYILLHDRGYADAAAFIRSFFAEAFAEGKINGE